MSKNQKNSQNNAKNRSGNSSRNSSKNCPRSSSKSGSQNSSRNQSDDESDGDGQGHLSKGGAETVPKDSDDFWRRQNGQICRIHKGARNYLPSGTRWCW